MKYLFILLLLINTTDPTEISRYNRLKSKAEVAFEHGQYDVAAQNYSMLYDSLSADDPAIALNLAHSYYALGDTSNALLKYQAAASNNNNKIKSIAYQQLGVMADKPETLNESLQYLKSALKADPTNEEARFNYELVKKKLEKQKEQQQDQQNQDQKDQDEKKEDQEQNQDKEDQQKGDQEKQDKQNQDNQEQQDQEQQDQEQQDQEQQDKQDGEQKEGDQEEQQQQEQEGEEKPDESKNNQEMSTKEKLEQMNISEEKAKMILEAMKNNEIQYIQQQRRKPTKAPDTGKPDW
jgi:Ca-activated chloride channel family protein